MSDLSPALDASPDAATDSSPGIATDDFSPPSEGLLEQPRTADARGEPGAPGAGPPPPKKRGRPKGATDKTPRKSRRARPPKKKAKASSPFDGEPAAASPNDAPQEEQTIGVELGTVMSPEKAADTILALANVVLPIIGKFRYPEPIAETLALKNEEQKAIKPPLVAVLKEQGVEMTPGMALCVTAGMVMLSHVMVAEAMLRQEKA